MILEDMLIHERDTILDAMEALNRTAKKVLFVVRDEAFVASVTDGDIRRWILANGNLEARIKNVANYQPRFIEAKDRLKAKQLLRLYSVEALPILDEQRKIVSVAFWDEKNIIVRKKFNIPIVIMAGGLGTRLYPYTKILPKPLIPVGDIPIIEHIINRFKVFGCKTFYLIVNHKKNMIKAYFNEIEKDYEIIYADEDKPLGTGGGLSLLKGKINSTFILSNCDILIEDDYEQMYRFHKQERNLITMVCSLKKFTVPYGVVELGEGGNIKQMREKPNMTFFTNTGFYIVEPKVIDELANDQVVGFPDLVEHYRQAGEKVGVYPISERAWMDMGQPEELEEMRKRLENNE